MPERVIEQSLCSQSIKSILASLPESNQEPLEQSIEINVNTNIDIYLIIVSSSFPWSNSGRDNITENKLDKSERRWAGNFEGSRKW